MSATTTLLDSPTLDRLRPLFGGDLLCPGDGGFDDSRRIWNGMIDRIPGVIARCSGVSDVRNALDFAREVGMDVAVKGGGHNVAGNALCDGGMVIDLSGMKGMRVDPKPRTARAEPGVLWGQFDRETQAFGLATTGGAVSTTGIAGLTLGGGVGWLMGKHGLTCDNLLSVDMVTADGSFLTASEDENAELFWGVRGGGGNFGIVTSFEYRLHELGPVLGGMVLHPIARAREVLRFYREFTATAPDELTTYVATMTAPDGNAMIAIILCWSGDDLEAGERAIAPVREFGPPVADMLQPMPYVALQSMLDAGVPHGQHSYWKANQLPELSDEAIETFVEHAERVTSPQTLVLIEHHHGALTRVAPDATAFRHRHDPYDLVIFSLWTDGDTDRHVRWTREFFEAMRPWFGVGVYMNALSEGEGDERVRASYGENYERLVALKRQYDPDNVFRFNQNIRP